jgi:hypothetical protein
MLVNAQGHTAIELLAAGSKAATANATGSAVDVSAYDGPMIVVQNIGAITGTCAGKIQDSADGSTDWQDVTGAAFTSASAAGQQSMTIDPDGTRKYIRYIGTIGTGPCVMAVVAIGKKKYVP